MNIDDYSPKEYIVVKNARVNNLDNLSVAIKRNKLTVITGVSGSGKSSLAFDTLYAEGQRMYVESLSSYARQFLGRMEKPDVDYIKGVSPAIAIEQKVSTKNARSTVGTSTEIYDYLKLMFSRIGKTYSPISGNEVKKQTVSDVVDFILSKEDGAKFMIVTPLIVAEGRSLQEELELLMQKGYSRVVVDGQPAFLEDLIKSNQTKKDAQIEILIDRASVQVGEEFQFRMSDSVQTAFFEGHGNCIVEFIGEGRKTFNDRFELDDILFEEPTVNFFTFNNPYGACRTCEGFGHVLGLDMDLVIPDKTLSVYEGAIAPWRSEKMGEWKDKLVSIAMDIDFPIHRPFEALDQAHIDLLWKGNKQFKGLNKFFEMLEADSHKIQYRVMLSRYRGRTVCPDCRGTRLRKDAGYVLINGKNVQDLVLLSMDDLANYFKGLKLNEYEHQVAHKIVSEIASRIEFIQKVGLGYLTLNRLSSTLSGGEFQRIKLATSLGSALVGSMYILDEPSIGLHPRDTSKLIEVLHKLRDLGNTVIVVEHEEDVMRASDEIIDIGPEAGSRGGKLMFQGTVEDSAHDDISYTGKFLNGREKIITPTYRRKWNQSITIKGASENNLQNIDVEFPLNVLTAITGVSGSGKSTLVNKIFYPAVKKHIGEYSDTKAKYRGIEGALKSVENIEFVDQNPIGKSSRSNPVTYLKAYDAIRNLYSEQELSKHRGYKPAHFSFNVDGGRCDNCQGDGEITVEMQFMADIHLTCEVCKGKRFKDEVLEVEYLPKGKEKGLNIFQILNLTVDNAIEFFADEKKIVERLLPLQKVGLGYIGLGQSSNTLSGGEAQRVKLAYFLSKEHKTKNCIFIFDEPTTGLHFHDIRKLMESLQALVDEGGHTVMIIEHNLEVVKCADWVIDLGPDGGDKGGTLCFAGTPEDLVKSAKGFTAHYLKERI
jgi:excinuclease ABC subunit A